MSPHCNGSRLLARHDLYLLKTEKSGRWYGYKEKLKKQENDHRGSRWRWEPWGTSGKRDRTSQDTKKIFAGLGQQNIICLNHLKHDNNMVVEKDIFFHSIHHFLPFYGKVHIAYIPMPWLGFSKNGSYGRSIRQTTDSERLTVETADALMEYLGAIRAIVRRREHM